MPEKMFNNPVYKEEFVTDYRFWNDFARVMQVYKPTICMGDDTHVFAFKDTSIEPPIEGTVVYTVDNSGKNKYDSNRNHKLHFFNDTFFGRKKGKAIKRTIETLIKKHEIPKTPILE